jgi:hypothetical protein
MPIHTTQNCHWVQTQDTQDKEEGPKVLPPKKILARWEHIFLPSFISSHVFYTHLIVNLVTLKTSKKLDQKLLFPKWVLLTYSF